VNFKTEHVYQAIKKTSPVKTLRQISKVAATIPLLL